MKHSMALLLWLPFSMKTWGGQALVLAVASKANSGPDAQQAVVDLLIATFHRVIMAQDNARVPGTLLFSLANGTQTATWYSKARSPTPSEEMEEGELPGEA